MSRDVVISALSVARTRQTCMHVGGPKARPSFGVFGWSIVGVAKGSSLADVELTNTVGEVWLHARGADSYPMMQ
jgi:hypothetical protein